MGCKNAGKRSLYDQHSSKSTVSRKINIKRATLTRRNTFPRRRCIEGAFSVTHSEEIVWHVATVESSLSRKKQIFYMKGKQPTAQETKPNYKQHLTWKPSIGRVLLDKNCFFKRLGWISLNMLRSLPKLFLRFILSRTKLQKMITCILSQFSQNVFSNKRIQQVIPLHQNIVRCTAIYHLAITLSSRHSNTTKSSCDAVNSKPQATVYREDELNTAIISVKGPILFEVQLGLDVLTGKFTR